MAATLGMLACAQRGGARLAAARSIGGTTTHTPVMTLRRVAVGARLFSAQNPGPVEKSFRQEFANYTPPPEIDPSVIRPSPDGKKLYRQIAVDAARGDRPSAGVIRWQRSRFPHRVY